jgi:hypothetical protein
MFNIESSGSVRSTLSVSFLATLLTQVVQALQSLSATSNVPRFSRRRY